MEVDCFRFLELPEVDGGSIKGVSMKGVVVGGGMIGGTTQVLRRSGSTGWRGCISTPNPSMNVTSSSDTVKGWAFPSSWVNASRSAWVIRPLHSSSTCVVGVSGVVVVAVGDITSCVE